MFVRMAFLMLAVAVSAYSLSGTADAGGNSGGGGGGGGGGGSVKPVEIRVAGYITDIDYELGTITVGASYYNTGTAWVTSVTKVSLDNTSCHLEDVQVGDWAELRYEWYSKVATKIAAITVPTP